MAFEALEKKVKEDIKAKLERFEEKLLDEWAEQIYAKILRDLFCVYDLSPYESLLGFKKWDASHRQTRGAIRDIEDEIAEKIRLKASAHTEYCLTKDIRRLIEEEIEKLAVVRAAKSKK